MQLHMDVASGQTIDEAIEDFELAVRALFSIHRRDIEILRSKVKERVKNHRSRNELQKQLERMVTAELRRERAA
jgi:hypothetical protein